MMEAMLVLAGALAWLFCGWLGGRGMKREENKAFPTLRWSGGDEAVMRIFAIVLGPILLAVALLLSAHGSHMPSWFKRSWF